MSTTTSNFHQETQLHLEKKQKIDHGSKGSGSSAAKDMDLGGETKNVPDLQENVCKNCGIGDHLTKDCRSEFYGRLHKYDTVSFSSLSPDTRGHDLELLCCKYGPVRRSAGPAEVKENVCKNCGIGGHLTKDCLSGFYGRLRKYDRNTVSFSNLSPDTRGYDLELLCCKYGPVPRSAGPAEIKGMGDQGLVAFENKEDAQMAIDKLNGSTFKGRVITVKWNLEKNVPDLPKNRCKRCGKVGHLENGCPSVVYSPSVVYNPIGKYIYNTIRVRNFPGDTDTSDISSFFSVFGPVHCVYEPGLHFKGKSHLGLMIAFKTREDAQAAIDKLNGSTYKGCVLTVDWPLENDK